MSLLLLFPGVSGGTSPSSSAAFTTTSTFSASGNAVSGGGSSANFWDFSQEILPSGCTFTRASTGAYHADDGSIRTAAVNYPRFERSAVANILGANSDLTITNGSYWDISGTATANGGVGPDGATTADFYVPGTAGYNGHPIYRNPYATGGTVSPSTTYEFSWDIKPVGAYTYCSFGDGMDGGDRIGFQLSGSGSITYSGSGRTGFILPLGNGWYRIGYTYTTTSGDSGAQILMSLQMSPTAVTSNADPYYEGDGTSGCYLQAPYEGPITAVKGLLYEPATGSDSLAGGAARSADVLTLTIPSDGSNAIVVTFDDYSTQTITGLSSGSYVVPTSLSRSWIRSIATSTYSSGSSSSASASLTTASAFSPVGGSTVSAYVSFTTSSAFAPFAPAAIRSSAATFTTSSSLSAYGVGGSPVHASFTSSSAFAPVSPAQAPVTSAPSTAAQANSAAQNLAANFPSGPFVDDSGNLTTAARLYLLQLHQRTGGNSGVDASATSTTAKKALQRAQNLADLTNVAAALENLQLIRQPGWTAPTGTADRNLGGTFTATAPSTYTQATEQAVFTQVALLTQVLTALILDLTSYGAIT